MLTELNKILIQERRKNEKEKLRELTDEPNQGNDSTTIIDRIEDLNESKVDVPTMVYYQERETIRLLLNYAEQKFDDQKLADYLLHELDDVEFKNEVFKNIFETFKSGLTKGEPIDNQYFLRNGTEAVKRMVTELVTSRYDASHHWNEKNIFFPKEQDNLNQLAITNVLRLKFRVVQKMMEDNLQLVKEFETKSEWEDLDKALEKQTGLKRAETELAGLLGIVVAK